MSKRLFLCVLFLLFGFLSNSHAVPQYYTFDGEIIGTSISPEDAPSVGDRVSYTFLIDSELQGLSTSYFLDGSPPLQNTVSDSADVDVFFADYVGGDALETSPSFYDGLSAYGYNGYAGFNLGVSYPDIPQSNTEKDYVTAGDSFSWVSVIDNNSSISFYDWQEGDIFTGQNSVYSSDFNMLSYNSNLTLTSISNTNPYDVAPVPEPSTILLMGLGLVGLAGFGRKKFRK